MLKDTMNGEKFYEFLQEMILNGEVVKIKSMLDEYGGSFENLSRWVTKAGEHPYWRDIPYHLIVKTSMTWFRRIQNLISDFHKMDDAHEIFTGFLVWFSRPGIYLDYHQVCLIPDDDEMALSLVRYLIPKLIEEGEQKNPIGIVLRFVKGFEHLKPDIIRYYKEMYYSN